MPIFPSLNCVLIHIPKTGGTAIEQHLAKKSNIFLYEKTGDTRNYLIKTSSPQHYLPNEIIKTLEWNRETKKFPGLVNFDPTNAKWLVVVRNPYSRFASEIRYIKQANQLPHSSYLNSAQHWFDKYHQGQINIRDNHIRPQYDYIRELEALSLDFFVIKFEDLLKYEADPSLIPLDAKSQAYKHFFPPPIKINSWCQHLTDKTILSNEVKTLLDDFYDVDFANLDYCKEICD